MSSEQFYFEFREWRDAFATFYRKRCGEELLADDGTRLGFRKGNPRLVFLISSASETSGYWIEEGATSDRETRVYRTVKAVKALEQRVASAIAAASQSHAVGRIIY